MTYLDRHMQTLCVVTRRVQSGDTDTHGNPVYVNETVTSRCLVQPGSRMEGTEGRSSQSGYTIFLPPEMLGHVDAFSRLDVEGYGRLECDGDPAAYRRMSTGAVHHIEVSARRSTA